MHEGQEPDKDLAEDFEIVCLKYFSKIHISLKLRVQNCLTIQNT